MFALPFGGRAMSEGQAQAPMGADSAEKIDALAMIAGSFAPTPPHCGLEAKDPKRGDFDFEAGEKAISSIRKWGVEEGV